MLEVINEVTLDAKGDCVTLRLSVPKNVAAEGRLIALLLRAPSAIEGLPLDPLDFSVTSLGNAYGAIRELQAAGRRVHIQSVASVISKRVGARRVQAWSACADIIRHWGTSLDESHAPELARRICVASKNRELLDEAIALARNVVLSSESDTRELGATARTRIAQVIGATVGTGEGIEPTELW